MDMILGIVIGFMLAAILWVTSIGLYQNAVIKQCERQSGSECVFVGWKPAP